MESAVYRCRARYDGGAQMQQKAESHTNLTNMAQMRDIRKDVQFEIIV